MYILFFILCASVVSVKPKLCVNCKFFDVSTSVINKFGKCTLFPKEPKDEFFLVDGIKTIEPQEYNFCSVARDFDNMCGKDGKFYEKKRKN